MTVEYVLKMLFTCYDSMQFDTIRLLIATRTLLVNDVYKRMGH